ncbi:hypothetical protein MXAN_5749 [Myxococcus xanthus DK 1622]|uniref:Uncharacterized protein n=2 Tax=Myxococcaceae TaxID=31 RepID=Q1D0D7_MYXXD|nr:hypothetical protein MXAN_5749 [Myxococcus xanthus DK 1622]
MVGVSRTPSVSLYVSQPLSAFQRNCRAIAVACTVGGPGSHSCACGTTKDASRSRLPCVVRMRLLRSATSAMTKTFEKAVTGFNHNIKHKGKVYHVQTEDSGVNNPHIITHLFVGGNILASKKTSYADILNAENLAEVVRELMEEQHKEMLRNLINGVYDSYESTARSYQPGQLAADTDPAQVKLQPGQSMVQRPPPPPPPVAVPAPVVVPPEVAAARALKEKPKINEIGVETLFGEDLISEKSLDEVILSYLAGEGEQ